MKMKMKLKINKQRGFAAYLLTIIILILLLSIMMGLSTLIYNQQKISHNITRSNLAYLAAEAGVEDVLLRLKDDMTISSPYSLTVGDATTDLSIVDSPLGGVKTIISEGDSADRIRKVEVVYQLTSDGISFNFGAHIGNPGLAGGGLQMTHSDGQIIGNVFSNANVSGSGKITESLIISGAGHSLSGVDVNLNVETYSCIDSSTDIGGDLEYNNSGSNSCDVDGSVTTTPDVIQPIDFPITPAMISDWKAAAEDGGLVDGGGDVNIGDNRTLGPGKITGNLTVTNGKILTISGTLWVTGTFIPGNTSTVKLDSGYGSYSGVLIADQMVDIGNLVTLGGSGSPGSFLAIVGTSPSLLEANPAIAIANNSNNAILFAPNGVIDIRNNANIVEITAHKLIVKKAIVSYNLGLQNTKFITGPGAAWEITSWKEIE